MNHALVNPPVDRHKPVEEVREDFLPGQGTVVTVEMAKGHADALTPAAFATTRTNTRQSMIDLVKRSLDEDMASFSVGG